MNDQNTNVGTYVAANIEEERMHPIFDECEVNDYAENLTPQSELDKLKAPVETFFLRRDPGAWASSMDSGSTS